jgi:hypothetical protein
MLVLLQCPLEDVDLASISRKEQPLQATGANQRAANDGR